MSNLKKFIRKNLALLTSILAIPVTFYFTGHHYKNKNNNLETKYLSQHKVDSATCKAYNNDLKENLELNKSFCRNLELVMEENVYLKKKYNNLDKKYSNCLKEYTESLKRIYTLTESNLFNPNNTYFLEEYSKLIAERNFLYEMVNYLDSCLSATDKDSLNFDEIKNINF